MDEPRLAIIASKNQSTFNEVLSAYVAIKLERVLQLLPHGSRTGWFDASGCVWCLFDDKKFVRSGDAGQRLREEQGEACALQVYWSMGDVVMPSACDERWVAERIAQEAMLQLRERGYRCRLEEREVEGGSHVGVRFRIGRLTPRVFWLERKWQKGSRPF